MSRFSKVESVTSTSGMGSRIFSRRDSAVAGVRVKERFPPRREQSQGRLVHAGRSIHSPPFRATCFQPAGRGR